MNSKQLTLQKQKIKNKIEKIGFVEKTTRTEDNSKKLEKKKKRVKIISIGILYLYFFFNTIPTS